MKNITLILFNCSKRLWNKFEIEDLVTPPLCDIFFSLIISLLQKGFQRSLFSGNAWKMIDYTLMGTNSAIRAYSSESSYAYRFNPPEVLLWKGVLKNIYAANFLENTHTEV